MVHVDALRSRKELAMARLTKEDIRSIVAETIEEQLEAKEDEFLEDFTRVVAETYQILLEEELGAMAKLHAEQIGLAQQIQEIADQKELDISNLATEAEKRAYALAVFRAEEALKLAEGSLADLRAKIASQQEYVNQYTQYVTTDSKKEKLADLLDQEKLLEARVMQARRRLSNLKLGCHGMSIVVPEV